MADVKVKATRGDDTRRFRVSKTTRDWQQFESTVRGLFGIAHDQPLRVTYQDSDGDVVVMSSSVELAEALNDAAADGTLRVSIDSTLSRSGGSSLPQLYPSTSWITVESLAEANNANASAFSSTTAPVGGDVTDVPGPAEPPSQAAPSVNAPPELHTSSSAPPVSGSTTDTPGPSGPSEPPPQAAPSLHVPPELQSLFGMFMPYVMAAGSHAAQAMAAEISSSMPAQSASATPPPSQEPSANDESYPPPSPAATRLPNASNSSDSGSNNSNSSNNNSNSSNNDRFVHWGVTCDGCNGPVVGRRYRCDNCSNADLCEGCHARLATQDENPAEPVHNPTHTFTYIPHPMSFLPPEASAQMEGFINGLPDMLGGYFARFCNTAPTAADASPSAAHPSAHHHPSQRWHPRGQHHGNGRRHRTHWQCPPRPAPPGGPFPPPPHADFPPPPPPHHADFPPPPPPHHGGRPRPPPPHGGFPFQYGGRGGFGTFGPWWTMAERGWWQDLPTGNADAERNTNGGGSGSSTDNAARQ